MFTRLGDILSAASEVLVADARLAWYRVERLGARLILGVALGMLAAIALCATLAGIAVVLAPSLGAGVAILLVAGSTLVGALIGGAILLAPFATTGGARQAGEDAARAKEKLTRLVHGDEPASESPEDGRGRSPEFEQAHATLSEAVAKALSSPDALAGAGFALVSVLGVKRSLRLARTVAGAAGTGVAVAKTVRRMEQATSGHRADARTNGRHAAPRPRVPGEPAG